MHLCLYPSLLCIHVLCVYIALVFACVFMYLYINVWVTFISMLVLHAFVPLYVCFCLVYVSIYLGNVCLCIQCANQYCINMLLGGRDSNKICFSWRQELPVKKKHVSRTLLQRFIPTFAFPGDSILTRPQRGGERHKKNKKKEKSHQIHIYIKNKRTK